MGVGAGTGVSVGASTGAEAGTVACAGTGAGGDWLSVGKLSCARKTAAPVHNARTITHNRPVKEKRSRKWEVQHMGIATV
jgi:hypothetical protein